jgi:hypothetical protein
VYDPRIDAWHITWCAPVGGVVVHLVGQRSGDEIVLEGTEPDGTLDRWVFSDITADSFVWSGYEAKGDPTTLPLVQRMHARRRQP